MERLVSRSTQIFLDVAMLSAAFALAFLFRFEFDLAKDWTKLLFFTLPYVVLFQYLVLVAFGVQRFVWRYIGLREVGRILLSLGLSMTVLVALRLALAPLGGYTRFVVIPLGILAVDFVLAFMLVVGIRVLRRLIAERASRPAAPEVAPEPDRALLIGAGSAGVIAAKEISRHSLTGLVPVGFVDDDPLKLGAVIQGLKILGPIEDLPRLADETGATMAVITMAAASGSVIRRVTELCGEIPLPVKIIPGVSEILDGRVNVSRIRDVTIDDLLGREAIRLDTEVMRAFLSGKRVLVTGAGGSIGSELCRQILNWKPGELVLVEQAENALFQIHQELLKTHPDQKVVPRICDICDESRVDLIFESHTPHVVFHAAAHKHVPMMEWNPGEAVKNNVFGTRTVADAASRHGVDRFILISTDKAVNPTSTMGTTKRVAEIVIQDFARRSRTVFSAVRFGNVLGSAGSVIPIFREQIRQGGPVTVTHPEMMRYFMTIPEACQLVVQAAELTAGGELFVLDMGEPIRIVDLARDMIRLSGFTTEEIHIEFTGIRPGEKLFEEFSTESEQLGKTRHPKIFSGDIAAVPAEKVRSALQALRAVTDSDSISVVREALRGMVEEMRAPDTEGMEPPALVQEPDPPVSLTGTSGP